MKKIKTLLYVVLVGSMLSSAFGESEKAVKFNYDLNAEGHMYYSPDSGQVVSGVSGKYSSTLKIKDKLLIPIDLGLDAYTSATQNVGSPTQSLTYPVQADIGGGLGFDGVFNFTACGFVNLVMSNNYLSLPWSSSESDEYLYGQLIRYNTVGADVKFNLPLEKIDLSIASLNSISNYGYENSQDESLNSGNVVDHDWWILPSFEFRPLEFLGLQAEYLRKSELDPNGKYDVNMIFFGLTTDARVLKKKLYIFGDLNGRYYHSPVMSDRGYLESGETKGNLGAESHLRSILKLKKKLYIKGDLLVDVSSTMTKLRYELGLKKVSKSGKLSGEAGYWSTPGTLFPRMCTYVDGRLGVNDYFAFIPRARFYWHWEEVEYSYYRTDLNLELDLRLPLENKVPIFRQLSLMGGAEYNIYDDVFFFPTTLNVYLGLRTYL